MEVEDRPDQTERERERELRLDFPDGNGLACSAWNLTAWEDTGDLPNPTLVRARAPGLFMRGILYLNLMVWPGQSLWPLHFAGWIHSKWGSRRQRPANETNICTNGDRGDGRGRRLPSNLFPILVISWPTN